MNAVSPTPQSKRLAAFDVAVPGASIRYELHTQPQGLLLWRVTALEDGSRVRCVIPFTQANALRELLAADDALAQHSVNARRLLAAARRHLSAGDFAPRLALGRAPRVTLTAVSQRLEHATGVFEMHDTLAAVARFLGLAGYAAVLGHWSDEDRTDLHWLGGIDPAWCMTFMNRHWYLNSALLTHARATDRPAFGSEVPAVTEGQRLMRATTLRFGLRCAIAFPRRLPPATPAGSFGAVLFLGRTDPPAGETGARRYATLVRGIVATFIDRWAQLIAAERARQTRLSPTERRLLACVAARQTTAQAAALLGIGTTAVNNHYRRINAKLGVNSKRAALARAQALGLLTEQPPPP